jgi:hypothetical protein
MNIMGLLVAAVVMTVAASASADPIFGSNDPPPGGDQGGHETKAERRARAEAFRPGFGARVGGYGFRDPNGGAAWDACRMNGFGVFGTLDLNKYVYGEVALDFYSAAPDTVKQGLDRTSSQGLVGAGFRMLPDFVITPYVELGGGSEYTRVELPDGVIDGVYPMGYAGLGLELNVTRELKLGATMRMLATTRPTFASSDGSGDIYGTAAESSLTGQAERPQMQFDFAAQGQFYVRYAL